MDGLIDLILENPFFLIILIGGIVSLLKGKAEQEKKQQEANRPKPTQAKQPIEHRRQPERTARDQAPRTEPMISKSVEELREEQMVRLSMQSDATGKQQVDDTQKISDKIKKEMVSKKGANRNEKAFKKDFNQSLTSKGLVNSVIMAEVLGAPRSREPYQTVITKRRNKL